MNPRVSQEMLDLAHEAKEEIKNVLIGALSRENLSAPAYSFMMKFIRPRGGNHYETVEDLVDSVFMGRFLAGIGRIDEEFHHWNIFTKD